MNSNLKKRANELLDTGRSLKSEEGSISTMGVFAVEGPKTKKWMNDVSLFASRLPKEYPLRKEIETTYFHRSRPSSYSSLLSYLESFISDDDFVEPGLVETGYSRPSKLVLRPMVTMDAASEEMLSCIISCYEENDDHLVKGTYSVFPAYLTASIKSAFDKLVSYGVISPPILSLNSWETFLTPSGFTYFTDKKDAVEREMKEKQIRSNSKRKQYDVFLSHASKDKSDYVESLYMVLRRLGISIFYDSDSISWGDNWKQAILKGTAVSEFAIIVISENFFGREWTERELSEFLKRQNESGQKIVLPLLHNITLDQLKEHYPELEEIQIIDTATKTKEEITILFAKELIKRYK